MKLNIITLSLAALFTTANVAANGTANEEADFDYLRAAEGVSHSHAHIQRIGGEIVDDPGSKTGSSWINSTLSNIEETNRIPLKKGHGFHVQLLMFKLPVETKSIQVSMTHPAMTLPDGQVLKVQSGSIPTHAGMGAFPEASFTYTLDEDYELVEGDWVLTFGHQGDELFHITFTTYSGGDS